MGTRVRGTICPFGVLGSCSNSPGSEVQGLQRMFLKAGAMEMSSPKGELRVLGSGPNTPYDLGV